MLPSFTIGIREARHGNFMEARRAFTEAAERGDAWAFWALGNLASNGQGEPSDPARAAELYRRGAEGGCAGAAHSLAALYALGRGVCRDPAEALRWYRRAGELGDRGGFFKVGTMLVLGEAGPPGPEAFAKAEQLFRQGAAAGHAPSMLFLGNLYNGLGPERSPAKAAVWYLEVLNTRRAEVRAISDARYAVEQLRPLLEIGAGAGDAEAAFALGGWHMTCDPDHAKAAGLFQQAAAKGHPGAQRSLGRLLMEGLGVARNEARAIELFEAAASGGDRFAQLDLGLCYVHGKSVPRSSAKAIAYLTAAAEQGLADAMAQLGDELGRADRNEEACAWYVKAAQRGHVGAMSVAAASYRDGVGVPRDLVQAVRWYWAMMGAGKREAMREAHKLVEQMTVEQLEEAARLAGDPTYAEMLLVSTAS
jgi:TPR repeat protein